MLRETLLASKPKANADQPMDENLGTAIIHMLTDLLREKPVMHDQLRMCKFRAEHFLAIQPAVWQRLRGNLLEQLKRKNITCFASQTVRFGVAVHKSVLIAASFFSVEDKKLLATALQTASTLVEQPMQTELAPEQALATVKELAAAEEQAKAEEQAEAEEPAREEKDFESELDADVGKKKARHES